MSKKPWVDKAECISCGLCVSACPNVFKFGNDSKSEAYNPSGAPEKEIQSVIDGCPVQCISWRE